MAARKSFIFLVVFHSVDVGPASEGKRDSPGQMPCTREWS